ncbi:regulator of protease activity HflC (stomatin/prohibitin superfamily) [Parabacteroides sp. PFB2-12]|uniref:SPFH domain-containing protein n=1 Tax=unclassified Parabacteroides TaxID=2649774 RepID=UPI00247598D5|nr:MULTISPECIES: SPFH domain-containing protein [unclassified Parabacteroides]MDH6344290.1 regulator of protease activity HflC (stomatin/prohibitin superfamily) [Parabacteroides sp. PM6-13]MDH6392191.1 regulator of protease activity HflC (stomatin/prohibitin superfamily) [Parabacteroides sp. PFB2-12]
MGITVILALIALFIIVFAAMGFKIIQQSETMVIERLGKYSRTLSSGINIIWPIIDKPRDIMWRYLREGVNGNTVVRKVNVTKIDLRETVYDFPRQNVITKDNVVTEINAILYFQITDPVKAVYEIANLPDAIEKLTQTTLRNVIGEMDLDQTLTSRDTINSKLRAVLDDATHKWGVKVNRVELQDINPPHDIRDAMEKQMRAERDKRAKILEAEGTKARLSLEAEGEKIAAINKAEGERQSQILRAEAEAEAKLKVAEAEAEAIKKITSAISDTKGDPINYLVAIRYIDTMKDMVSGKDNKVIYLPYEATGVLGSIGGIKDMFKG